MTIRVVIADDQELVRTGLRVVLEEATDISVVGEAKDGAQALTLIARTKPDIVLMDIRMPNLDGVEATRRIQARDNISASTPRVIILTTFDLDEYVLTGLRVGASGFLLKDTLASDLLSAIRSVAAGEAVIAPTTTRRLIERFLDDVPASQPGRATALTGLTPREREILGLVGQGLTNSEIAGRLFLSEGTVKNYVGHILAKLDLRDRIQAVILAYETGLIRRGLP
jgi:DNA-binding NarL/FixJ family response regulator